MNTVNKNYQNAKRTSVHFRTIQNTCIKIHMSVLWKAQTINPLHKRRNKQAPLIRSRQMQPRHQLRLPLHSKTIFPGQYPPEPICHPEQREGSVFPWWCLPTVHPTDCPWFRIPANHIRYHKSQSEPQSKAPSGVWGYSSTNLQAKLIPLPRQQLHSLPHQFIWYRNHLHINHKILHRNIQTLERLNSILANRYRQNNPHRKNNALQSHHR